MSEDRIIEATSAQEMPGALRKGLHVPEDYTALLLEGGELVGQRGSGEHRLGNWPKPAPDALLLSLAPFDLRPRIQHLQSHDRQRFDLVWPITVQVADPDRFYTEWLANTAGPEEALVDLEDHLAGLLWDSAQKRAVQYGMDDLQLEDEARAALARDLRAVLLSALDHVGLKLVGTQRPRPQTLADERAALASMNQALQAARDARFEALFARLEDREMLEYRLQEWAAERGEPAPDAAVADLLWQVVDEGPEEAALRAQQAAQALKREVDILQLNLASERTQNERRFRQMLARLEKDAKVKEEPEPRDPARWLKWLLFVLRILGTGVAVAAALIALFAPQMNDQYLQLRTAALIFTVVVGALTLFSDLILRRQVHQVRQEAVEKRESESRASLQRRLQADSLVRARVESGLQQVAGSLEAAWKAGYGAGDATREMAVKVRETAREAARLGEQEVRVANYQAGRYLAQSQVPDEQLAAVLDLDEELLASSQTLARTAENLYEQMNAGQVDAVRASLRELQNALNRLRNRFTERGAYLMDPA